MLSQDRQIGARRNPHQVYGVRRWIDLVKVVHAPDEPPLQVSPRPEIFDVQISHSKHFGGFRQLATDFRPKLQPPIERRPEEWKRGLSHELMFKSKILPDYGKLRAEPLLKLKSGFNDSLLHFAFTRVRVPREMSPARAIRRSGTSPRTRQPACV